MKSLWVANIAILLVLLTWINFAQCEPDVENNEDLEKAREISFIRAILARMLAKQVNDKELHRIYQFSNDRDKKSVILPRIGRSSFPVTMPRIGADRRSIYNPRIGRNIYTADSLYDDDSNETKESNEDGADKSNDEKRAIFQPRIGK